MTFKPGEHGEYSSTNMMLLGLVVMSQAPEGHNNLDKFDLREMLGIDFVNDYKHLVFPVRGTMNEVGQTVPGTSFESHPPTQMWKQDQSISGFTAGNGIASAHDVARFYWDYLGPEKKIVS